MKLIRLAAIPAALALAASAFILAPSAFAGAKPPAKTCKTISTTTYKQVKEISYKWVKVVTYKTVNHHQG
jgi:hypothetical protein